MALAFWARPGRRRREHLTRDLALFVGPAAVTSSLLGLVIFYGALLLGSSPTALVGVPGQLRANLPLAQSTLITFLVFCGLLLIVFVEPPNAWWAGAAQMRGDWKPTILAGCLLVAFIAVSAAAPLRRLFDPQPLDLPAIGLAAGVLVWLFTVRACWQARLLERFLGQ